MYDKLFFEKTFKKLGIKTTISIGLGKRMLSANKSVRDQKPCLCLYSYI